MTIHEVLKTPIFELIKVFEETNKIYSVLNSMIDLGLGYLNLGQMSMNLSGGEAQRVKLAKALGTPSKEQNLYILDEPTSGLNNADISKFEKVLFALQEKGNTILIVEHNIEFISHVADYIVDFGLVGGYAGGKIVSQGCPQDVFENEKSSFVHTMLHSPFTSLSKNQSSPHIKQLKRIRHPFMHHICLYRRRKGLYQSITLSNKLLRVGIITNLFHQILIWNWENYGYSPPTLLVDTVLSQLWNQLESSS